MPTTQRKTAPAAKRAGTDAIALLKEDHAVVKSLFTQYQILCNEDAGEREKGALATRICQELTVHATIEEEILYPALREALEEQDILDEAEVEHATAKSLIAQIEQADAGDDLYDARVIVLGEYIDHHVGEEEREIFRKARNAGVDLNELGAALEARQHELQAGAQAAEDDEEEEEEEEDEDQDEEQDDDDTEDADEDEDEEKDEEEDEDLDDDEDQAPGSGRRSSGNRSQRPAA